MLPERPPPAASPHQQEAPHDHSHQTHRGRRPRYERGTAARPDVRLRLVGAPPARQPPRPARQGLHGVGYVQDSKDFKPDTRQLALDAKPEANLKANPVGIDVSSWQGGINWSSVRGAGIEFAWMKATEGLTYKDPTFSANYLNAYNAGVIRGAYHYARPDVSGGAAQADFFASNGGAWSPRQPHAPPGVLDIEGTCYGYSQAGMRQWVLDFYNKYKARTGRDVVIYTSPSWWNTCTGGWNGMSALSPLWVAHWTSAAAPASRPASPSGRSGSTAPPAR